MAILHVRNVPPELYERLKHLAAEQHRSLSAEVIDILAQGVATRDRSALMNDVLESLAAVRTRGGPAPKGYAADLIRESRGDILDP